MPPRGPEVMDMNPEKQAQKLNTGTSHHNHGLWMVICCALPLALIVGFSLLRGFGGMGMLGFDSSLPGGPLFSDEEHERQKQAEAG